MKTDGFIPLKNSIDAWVQRLQNMSTDMDELSEESNDEDIISILESTQMELDVIQEEIVNTLLEIGQILP
jgi:hypothetical protein